MKTGVKIFTKTLPPKTQIFDAGLITLINARHKKLGKEIPITEVRESVGTHHGCTLFNGNCERCMIESGGCWQHITTYDFDKEVDEVIKAIDNLEEI